MSDSDSEGGGHLGLGGILWGNLGEGDELDVDYLDKDAIQRLGAVNKKLGSSDLLGLQHGGPSAADSAGRGSASSADAAEAAPGAADYADEPTLPEDLEDLPELRPRPSSAASALPGGAGSVFG
eukprot:gene11320-11470_t